MIGNIIQRCAAALLVAFCLLGNGFAMAHSGEHQDGWVDVGGNVRFGEAPVCALVLINGQTQFSCDGTGRYDMQVPVDDNGMITVMVFADGFAPFNQTVTPEEAAAYPINILLDQHSPSFQVETTYEPSATEGWFVVSGTINSGTTPVCALALANGQSMFSCAENLGKFSLDAPPDQDGNITLMVFAAGFKPFKVTANVLDSDGDGIRNDLDYDDDNDGILDTDDTCPVNPRIDCVMDITDTIFVNGKEWAQVDLFTNLSWDDINAVCPAGMCNGTLNGYDMSGWTWASSRDLQALFNEFGTDIDLDVYTSRYDMDSGGAVSWRATGWRPTQTRCWYYATTNGDICNDLVDGHLLNHDGFVASWAEPGGLVVTCDPSGPPCLGGDTPDSNGNVKEWVYGHVNVVFHEALHPWGEPWESQQRSEFVGGWFYK